MPYLFRTVDKLAPPLETLTPTKAESETDWWKASFEYFEGNHVQSEAVSEQLEIEKDGLILDCLRWRVMHIIYSHSDRSKFNRVLLDNLESRCLRLEGDEREFGVVSDGDILAYMSPGPSYTSSVSTAQKSLPLANRRKLRVRRTPLKLKSPMRCYLRKFLRCTKPPPGSTTPCRYPRDKTNKGITCEPSFWDILYPGGEKAEYLEQGKLDGPHINAFIELMMRKRPRNAQWTLGLSELLAFHIDSRKLMSMVLVVDALRATIDGTNLRYPSWHKISQVIFLINMDNKHWVAASWNLDDCGKLEGGLNSKFTLSPLDVLQGFSFFLQMGFTLILATLDGLDVGLLGDVIGEDDCDDDG
ncbi:hypothetical protein Tco_1419993 [Tanacetum coccineum]